jgi:hypothetical protein
VAQHQPKKWTAGGPEKNEGLRGKKTRRHRLDGKARKQRLSRKARKQRLSRKARRPLSRKARRPLSGKARRPLRGKARKQRLSGKARKQRLSRKARRRLLSVKARQRRAKRGKLGLNFRRNSGLRSGRQSFGQVMCRVFRGRKSTSTSVWERSSPGQYVS